MNMFFIFCFVAVLAFTAFFYFAKSASWQSVDGLVVNASYETLSRSSAVVGDEYGSLSSYKVNIEYTYIVGGKEYSGDVVTAGLPNVVSDKADALNLIETYRKGAHINVYVDAKNPHNSALITAGSIGLRGVLIIGFMVVLVGMFVGGGVYLVNRL